MLHINWHRSPHSCQSHLHKHKYMTCAQFRFRTFRSPLLNNLNQTTSAKLTLFRMYYNIKSSQAENNSKMNEYKIIANETEVNENWKLKAISPAVARAFPILQFLHFLFIQSDFGSTPAVRWMISCYSTFWHNHWISLVKVASQIIVNFLIIITRSKRNVMAKLT